MTHTRSLYALVAAGAVALAALGGAAPAHARSDVVWSVGIGVPGVVVGAGNGAGVYYPPPPVYYAPPPAVYYPPRPVYYAPPPPVYYAPPPPHWRPHGAWGGHGPNRPGHHGGRFHGR